MPGKPRSPARLDEALSAIADGAPLAWPEIEARLGDPAQIEVLRLLDDVAHAYRGERVATTAQPRQLLFRWGPLEVEAMIGNGSYAEVYRAFDPWLGRHVGLKLARSSGGGLDEARRLARLRHRNVLNVYGCAVHDDRPGLWGELIDGRTLADVVASDGALSEEEALRIGRDLANALAAVHAAGLVHGDVKAANVMRESGGRIVLMDFGAGGDQRLLASRNLISGTPAYLPPEVLDGAPLSIQSDIYALGVLLYFLLGGRYPYAQSDVAELRSAQENGKRASLHALRCDVEPKLCALIETCIAADPARRPQSASAFAAQLAQHGVAQATRSSRMRAWAGVAACTAAIAIGTVVAWPHLFPPAWASTIEFLRVEANGDVPLDANATLHVGDRMRMRARSSRDTYLYVLNEDAAGNATVLYPLNVDAPTALHAGEQLQLPGGTGSTQAYEVTADSAREEFLVVAALAPVSDLQGELRQWHHATATATATDPTRGVGAIVNVSAPVLHGTHLHALLAKLSHDPAHVRIWQFSFAHGD
ncbi:MAG TPA: protein kinase [Rudaea sp.]|nr:protein kinase [Rudaea sp.]